MKDVAAELTLKHRCASATHTHRHTHNVISVFIWSVKKTWVALIKSTGCEEECQDDALNGVDPIVPLNVRSCLPPPADED